MPIVAKNKIWVANTLSRLKNFFKEFSTCPENRPFVYAEGTMCCAEQPVGETCNADKSGCPPRIPTLPCADHPTAVREGIFYFLRSKHFFIVTNLKTSQFWIIWIESFVISTWRLVYRGRIISKFRKEKFLINFYNNNFHWSNF